MSSFGRGHGQEVPHFTLGFGDGEVQAGGNHVVPRHVGSSSPIVRARDSRLASRVSCQPPSITS